MNLVACPLILLLFSLMLASIQIKLLPVNNQCLDRAQKADNPPKKYYKRYFLQPGIFAPWPHGFQGAKGTCRTGG